MPRLWRSLAVAAILPIGLTILGLSLSSAYQRNLHNLHDASLSLRQANAAQTLLRDVKDAERSQRGYALTGDRSFLAPFERVESGLAAQLSALDRLAAASDSNTQTTLRHLDRLTEAKFVEMRSVIEARDQSGLAAAAAMVGSGRGKALMDSIEAETAKLIRLQDIRVASSEQQAADRSGMARLIYWSMVLCVSLIGFLIAYVMWSNRRGRYLANRAAAEAYNRQAALFESDFNAVVLINPSGGIEILNGAAEKLFGYPKTALMRRDISLIADLAPGEGAFLDRLGLTPEGLAQPLRTHVKARTADGGTVPVEVALGIMQQADGAHIVASFRDVSERDKVEQLKDQFLSTVSHELRTPLTSIVGSLGLLRGGAAHDLPAPVQRLVVIAENNANRLIRIVNDLLDVEKMQSGEMRFDFQPMDLRIVAQQALDGVRPVADLHNVLLEIDLPGQPVIVRGDQDRIVQVATNLLSNAIKFSPAGSAVTLTLGVRDNDACISVRDRGPGIDAELRARLFTRFAQAMRRSDTAGPGTGIGLTISREIVHNHGGTIWFEDAEGGGSLFAFAVPLWNALTGQEDLNGAPRLLIYADAAEAQAISTGFSVRAIRADLVHTQQEALAAISARPYLAFVLDFQFADGDAVGIVQAIRDNPAGRNLPVIAIAPSDPVVEPAQMAALDIIDWIAKPIAANRLDEAVNAAIRRASTSMPLVLHIDDDSDTLEITANALSGLARIARATDLASARAFLATNAVDIAIVDIALPDGSGLDILPALSPAGGPATPVIIYSAQDSGHDLAADVEVILTKSKKSLPNLVETVMGILDRQRGEGAS
ncbi:CHASE3 domain-containing protein [Sphingobium phenoxybenzoativorans]|uniref:histidine kinase n=1 Tax=Sphingobium phenoxybenzoativorans TaxID=1592790 RepID=A0A975K5F2_9SPHN|nr:ATP-binding protein [Sphingobium phenoxybenzoativorans]QUT04684.1 CHASE3 domain-containing protein [Sphingobium phenoxybenzoativorans]